MPVSEPGRHEARPRRGARRLLNYIPDFLIDTVGEFVIAVTACTLFAATAVGLIWGWERAPRSTVALVVGVLSLVGVGVYLLIKDEAERPRSTLASLAVALRSSSASG